LRQLQSGGQAIALFSLAEGDTDCVVAPLTRIYHCVPASLGVPDTLSHMQHPAHSFDAELNLMLLDKDILHFRRIAVYVAIFGRIVSN